MARADHLSQLRKGVLELAILALVSTGPRYGGQIVEELAARPGLDASAGTVYPLLTRLNSAGLLDTSWQESPVGPPRKYYQLNRAGRDTLAQLTASWQTFAATLNDLLKEAQ